MSYKQQTGGLNIDLEEALDSGGASGDYTSVINTNDALRDPRFLLDLREHYDETGGRGISDEQLIEKFYRDKVWADFNTFSAVSDAASAYGMGEDARKRAKRIETVYRQLPMPWQEGGRGMASATGDVAGAVIMDPVNLIPGFAAGKAALTAGRAAMIAGKSAPILRGVGKGAAVGAGSEALISGGQAAVHDTALQARDVQLGLQDEIDLGRTALATTVGTVAGGGIGGLIGAGAGAIGAKRGVSQVENAIRLGLTPEQIDNMTPADWAEFTKATQDTAALLPDEQDTAGLIPDETVEAPPEVVPDAPPDNRTVLEQQFDLMGDELDRKLGLERQAAAALKADGGTAEQLEEASDNLRRYNVFKNLSKRLRASEKEIDVLLQSSDLKKQKLGQQRQALLDDAITDLLAATRKDDGTIDVSVLNRKVDEAVGTSTEAPAPTTEATTEAAPGNVPEAEAPASAPEAPTAEVVDVNYSTPTVASSTESALALVGKSTPDIQRYIDEGKVQLGRSGKFTNKSFKQLKTALDSEEPAAAPQADAPASTRTWEDVEKDVENGVINLDEAGTQLEAMGIDPADLGGEMMTAREYFEAIRAAEIESDATPVFSPIALKQRQQALIKGTDWRNITGTGAKGKITKKDITNASVDPAYTKSVMDDLDTILPEASVIGDELTRSEMRNLVRALANDPEFSSDADDVLAMFDYHHARSLDEVLSDVKFGRLTKEDAALEIKQSGRQPKNSEGKSVSKKEWEARLNRQKLDSISNEIVQWTQSEIKLMRDLSRKIMEDGATSKVDADSQAQLQVLQRKLKGKTAVSSGDLSSSAKRVAETKNIEGAGRDPNTGKIQGILRAGIPTSEGRTINTSGLDQGEEKFISTASFGAQEALLRAKQNGVITEFSPAQSVRQVMTMSGKKDFPAGSALFADPRTNRIYDSRETALTARGELTSKPSPVSTSAPGAPSELLALIRAAIASNDGAALKRLIKRQKQPDQNITPDTLTDPLPNTLTAPRATEDTPLVYGDRVLVVQRVGNEADIRLAGPSQRVDGKGVQNLIGANQKPENWSVRYALANEAEGVRNAADRRELWNSANTVEQPSGTEDAPGMRRFVGDATGIGSPMPAHEFDELSLSNLKTKGLLLKGEPVDVQTFLDNLISEVEFINPDGRRLGLKSGQDLRRQIVSLEKLPYGKQRSNHRQIAEWLSGLHAIERDISPGGVVRNTVDRAESIRQVEAIFTRFSPDEVAIAGRIISRLGGDPSVGPVLREAPNSQYSAYSAGPDDNFIRLSSTLNGSTERVSSPATENLLHELGHWSYRNILTPEDRSEFWRTAENSMYRGGEDDAGLVMPESPPHINNQVNPQEYFANQFAHWAMKNRTDGVFATETYWRKINRYVEQIFNWFVKRQPVDSDLVPLFSKILPEEDRQVYRLGVDDPVGDFQTAIVKHSLNIRLARDSINSAIREGNDDAIINAFSQAQSALAAAAPGRVIPGQATNAGATFSALRPLEKMIRDRFGDINQVMSGKVDGPVEANTAAPEFGTSILGDAQEQASVLQELWLEGHAGGFTPLVRPVDPGEESKFAGNTSIEALFNMMDRTLEAAFASEGKKLAGVPASIRSTETATPSATGKAAVERVKKGTKATERSAIQTAKTPRKKRKSSGKTSAAEPSDAAEIRSASTKELVDLYRREAGTDRGQQIAEVILARRKAEPLPAKYISRPQEIKSATKSDLSTMLASALDAADSKKIDQILFEVQRRSHNKGNKGIPGFKPVYREVGAAIERELADHAGVQTNDGIPANARGQVRSMLSYLTHRDPEVQTTMRTMTYRMVNLLGKSQRGGIEDTNFMTMGDIARMSGEDLSGLETGAFMDFRGPEFGSLRKDLRRLSVGLNKGKSTPFDVVHEVSHMLTRSGLLPDREIDAIRESWRSLDINDPLKKQTIDTYTSKYANREYTDIEMDNVLADEWFAESFTRYLSERVAKGDITQAALTGNMNSVALRGTVSRAIDRLVEYVSYVLNGLIGRTDIKQTFRRITFSADMLEDVGRAPMSARRLAVGPENAAAYSADRYMASPRNKKAHISRFVGNGLGYDVASDTPVVWYHATPVAHKFDANTNPDEVFNGSVNGNYGPGQYLSLDPGSTRVYGDAPTASAILRAIDEADIGVELKTELSIDALYVSSIRKEMAALRREYSMLRENPSGDEVSDFLNGEQLDRLKAEIESMAEIEVGINTRFARHDIASNPGVIPFYIRALKPADFSVKKFYEPDDQFVRLLQTNLRDAGIVNEKEVSRFANRTSEGVDGRQLYQAYVSAFRGDGGTSDGAAKELATISLVDNGYDSLKTTHYNSVDSVDVGEALPDGRPYGADIRGHETVVLFDETQSKNIDAEFFDQSDPRMHYREEGRRNDFSSLNATIADAVMDGASPKDMNLDALVEGLEQVGASRLEADALRSTAAGRPLSAPEEQAIRKLSPLRHLQEQSQRMEGMGLRWLGSWYKDHFPDINQRFAKTYMPIRNKLRKLPDSDGRVRAWARASSGGVGQKQPKSYTRIVKALRRGEGSAQHKALSPQEREVFTMVRSAMETERGNMVKAGMSVGYRENYVPQVWNKAFIQKNRVEFLQDMSDYFKREKTRQVPPVLADDAEAIAFAERMYLTLADDSADGVLSPIHGSTRNPKFEHADFSRMIELDQDKFSLDAMEKYLESDLEFLLTKYLEGSTRRLSHTEKLGLNSHGVYDYMKVIHGGQDGIASLLSTNREFRKDVRFVGPDGYPESAVVIDTTKMPFVGKEAESQVFSRNLIETHATQGSGAARKMLD